MPAPKLTTITLLAAALAGGCFHAGAPAAPSRPTAPARPAAPAPEPRPGFDLERLKELDDPRRSPEQKAKLALKFYRDELQRPTPRPGPPFTDYRTHDYVLAQITRRLAACGADLAVLKQHHAELRGGTVKDCLTLCLLLRGEREQQQAAAAYVLDRSRPMRLRELAVEALAQYALQEDDEKLGALFAQVVREDTQSQYRAVGKPARPGERPAVVLVYPVRRAAAAAIRKLEAAGMLLESHVTAAGKVPAEVPLPPPGR
jgi:hypothetical protein